MIVIKNARVRKILGIAVPFVLIPLLVALGAFVFDEKAYMFVSLGVTVLSLCLFVTGFEKKKTGTRRLIIVAVMVALSVVGRFIPFFKPVTALTVMSAVYLGSEAGFLVGALSAVISNFYFGQGPWTPFQMLALGLIGLFAGLLASPLRKSRLKTVIYGVASGILYSCVMDIWTVMWYNGTLDFSLYLTALATAVPHTLMYCVSNAAFLWLFAKPFGEKLERVKTVYGV